MLRALALLSLALGLLLAAANPAGACCRRVHLGPRTVEKGQLPPLAIGDSVMIPAARRLARSGFEVDAREGRFMRHALRILRTRKHGHRRPRLVVVAIGTNYPATYAEIRRALRLLGPGRVLAMVTPWRSYRALDSSAIWRAKRRHPHRVRVIDWAATAAGHTSWFWSDGTHLRPAGARAYARLLRTALPHPQRAANSRRSSRWATAAAMSRRRSTPHDT
jgi:hypothetical protein